MRRRKKSEIPFAEALEFARKRLAKAQKERTVAVRTLASLDVEIPNLQGTIRSLETQLSTPQSVFFQSAGEVWENNGKTITQVSATLSNFGQDVPDPTPVTEVTEDELLPDPEGTELIPE